MRVSTSILLWLFNAFTVLNSVAGLDFESALRENAFKDLRNIYSDYLVRARYELDKRQEEYGFMAESLESSSENLRNWTITFLIDDLDYQQSSASYNLELSLTIIKLTFHDSASDHSRLKVQVRSNENNTSKYTVRSARSDPYEPRIATNIHLFRTWPFYDTNGPLSEVHPDEKAIEVRLENWHPLSSIYFTATVSKRMRRTGDFSYWNNYGCSYLEEFGCESNGYGFYHQVCIPSSLLCNNLPNCGQNYLPNGDEDPMNVCYNWSFVTALQIMIYILAAIAGILIFVGIGRYIYYKFWPERRPARRTRTETGRLSTISDFITNSLPRRPRNAPPTYEDATKNDNHGFVGDDEEPPPSYPDIQNTDSVDMSPEESCNETRSSVPVVHVEDERQLQAPPVAGPPPPYEADSEAVSAQSTSDNEQPSDDDIDVVASHHEQDHDQCSDSSSSKAQSDLERPPDNRTHHF